MADTVCIGGGSQDAWISLSPQQILQGFGYSYNASDPLTTTYQSVAKQYNPYGSSSKFYAGFNAYAEACMRSRSLLFCNSTVGDCGGGQSNIGVGLDASLAGEALGFATTGAGIGEAIAGASSSLGGITLGISDIVGFIIGIFENHAKAVAGQANALCTLSPEISSSIAQIDATVSSGQATSLAAANGIASMSQQFANAVQKLTKNCNAFCMYTALIKCVAAITPAYYQTFGTLEVAAPTSITSPAISSYPAAPGSMPSVTGAVPGVVTQQIPSASGTTWLLIAAAIVLILFVIG